MKEYTVCVNEEVVTFDEKHNWILEQRAHYDKHKHFVYDASIDDVREGSFEEYLAYHYGIPDDKKHLAPQNEKPEVPRGERTTFIRALEDAFWQAGGPKLLTELAQDNPLEFIKICSKLIPVDVTNKTPQGGFAIQFNITQADETNVIDHEEVPSE